VNTTTGLSSSPPPLLAFAPGGAAAPGERFLSYSGQFLEPPAAAIWVNFFWVSFACHFWVSVRSLACKISCGDFGVFSEARIGFTLVLVLSNISLWDLFGLVFEFFVGKRKYTRFFSLASSCPLLDYKQRGTLPFQDLLVSAIFMSSSVWHLGFKASRYRFVQKKHGKLQHCRLVLSRSSFRITWRHFLYFSAPPYPH
jgi:hypothetical protein